MSEWQGSAHTQLAGGCLGSIMACTLSHSSSAGPPTQPSPSRLQKAISGSIIQNSARWRAVWLFSARNVGPARRRNPEGEGEEGEGGKKDSTPCARECAAPRKSAGTGPPAQGSRHRPSLMHAAAQAANPDGSPAAHQRCRCWRGRTRSTRLRGGAGRGGASQQRMESSRQAGRTAQRD